MARVLLLVVVLALAAGCAGDPYAKAPTRSETKTQLVPHSQVYAAPFGSDKGHPLHVRAHVVVTEGGAIDAWLANAAGCAAFGTRNFTAVAKALNVTDATLTGDFDAPLAQNQNCLILDNTAFAMGEAKPSGNVTVSYTIDLWSRAG